MAAAARRVLRRLRSSQAHRRWRNRRLLRRLQRLDIPLARAIEALECEVGWADRNQDGKWLGRWLGVDLQQVFGNVTEIAGRGHEPPAWIRAVELVRNVLVLMPVTVTWLGLDRAARIYGNCVKARPGGDPKVFAETPFLAFWQLGFEYPVRCPAPQPAAWYDDLSVPHTFAGVIQADIFFLVIILSLTFVVHLWMGWRRSSRMKLANEIDLQLRRRLADLQRRIRKYEPAADVTELARQASQATFAVVSDFATQSRELTSVLVQHAADTRKALDGSVTLVLGRHEAAVLASSRRLEASVTSMSATTSQVSADFSATAGQLSASLRQHATAAEAAMRQGVAAVGKSTEAMVKVVSDRSAEVTRAMRTEAEASRKALEDLRRALPGLTDTLERAARGLETGAQQLSEMGSGLERRAGEVATVLTSTQETLSTLRTQAQALADQIPNALTRIGAEVGQARGQIGEISASIAGIERSTSAMDASLGALAELVSRTGRDLTQLSQSEIDEVKLLSEGVQSVGQELRRLVIGLRAQLHRMARPSDQEQPAAKPTAPTPTGMTAQDGGSALIKRLVRVESALRRVPGASDPRVLVGAEVVAAVAPPISLMAEVAARMLGG